MRRLKTILKKCGINFISFTSAVFLKIGHICKDKFSLSHFSKNCMHRHRKWVSLLNWVVELVIRCSLCSGSTHALTIMASTFQQKQFHSFNNKCRNTLNCKTGWKLQYAIWWRIKYHIKAMATFPHLFSSFPQLSHKSI